MPTRTNRFFNNPEFAAIASNLSSMFAPPSAQDELAYTQARAQREQASRLSDLWASAGDDFDRQGVAAGQWAPNQSYYSVDQANATDRRGQDVTAATARRGQDVSAQTTLATNMQDNRYGLASDIATTVVGPGERALGSTALDADIAVAAGLAPGMPIEGRAETLSSDEVLAAVMQDQIGSNPQYGRDLAMNELETTTIVGPDGVTPRNAFAGRAAELSLPAYVNQGGRAGTQPIEYVGPDGQRRVGSYDPNTSQYVDAAGNPLPDGISDVVELGQLQGDREGLGQSTMNRADERYRASIEALDLIADLEQTLEANPGATGTAGGLQRLSQNLVATIDEMSQAFNGRTPTIDEIMNSGVGGVVDAQTGGDLTGQYFNTALPEAQMLTNQLVWAYAAAQQGDGRVSNQQMEMAQRALGINGALSNNQQVLAAARKMRETFERRVQRDGALASPDLVRAYSQPVTPSAPAQPTTSGPAPGTVEDGYEFLGGDPADPNSWRAVQ